MIRGKAEGAAEGWGSETEGCVCVCVCVFVRVWVRSDTAPGPEDGD